MNKFLVVATFPISKAITTLMLPSLAMCLVVLSLQSQAANVAEGKPTTQSEPTAYGGYPSRAVDGNDSGVWSDGSVTHTSKQQNPWWEVDLGGLHRITKIEVWNRTDTCCAERLNSFEITVYDRIGELREQQNFSGGPKTVSETSPDHWTFTGDVLGNVVRVHLNSNDYLSLAEVRVEGKPVPTGLKLASVEARYPNVSPPRPEDIWPGRPYGDQWVQPVSDTWNGSLDLRWTGHPIGVPGDVHQLVELIAMKRCCVTFLVDGIETPVLSEFDQNADVVTKLPVPRDAWPETVQLKLRSGNRTWQSQPTRINVLVRSYFASHLYNIFQHHRCRTCHSFGTGIQAGQHVVNLVAMHEQRIGRRFWPPEDESKAFASKASVPFCAECHMVEGWTYPWDLPFGGKSSGELCRRTGRVFSNEGTKLDPSGVRLAQERLNEHFHNDPRMLWALTDGRVPTFYGPRPDLPVLFPGDPSRWFRLVDPWVEAGMPCPEN